MKIDLRSLALFSDFMTQCLSSGMSLARSLELSGTRSQSPQLRRVTGRTIDRVGQGMSLWEALEPDHRLFPRFFIPVLRCGEEGGRQIETLAYLADYCRKLQPQAQIIRKTWFYPVCIIIFGWIVQLALFLTFGKGTMAWMLLRETILPTGAIVAAVAIILRIQPLRTVCDTVRLYLPLISETEISVGTNTFLKAFGVIYTTGGVHPARMITLAADTIGNTVLRNDFLRAHAVLDNGYSFTDAFAKVTWLNRAYKQCIETGEESGKLEEELDRMITLSVGDLEFRLDIFNQFFHRLMSFAVIGAVAAAAYAIIFSM